MEREHFEEDDTSGEITSDFMVRRPRGWYYLQLNVILYRQHAGKMFAQVERFFFAKRPVEFSRERGELITMPVVWPSMPIEEMGSYGTIRPSES